MFSVSSLVFLNVFVVVYCLMLVSEFLCVSYIYIVFIGCFGLSLFVS